MMSEKNTQQKQETGIARYEPTESRVSVFSTGQHFDQAQRVAKMLSQSDLVPKEYQGKVSNCLIAMEIAQRTGTGAFEVMQNLEIIHGRPSWKSSYVIAKLNACGRFTPLEFETEELGQKTVEYTYTVYEGNRKSRKTGNETIDDQRCRVITKSRTSGRTLYGPWVSIEMAVKEGWYSRSGSKWQTMPEIMLQYRAASFFGRMAAPEVLLGMHAADEVMDIGDVEIIDEGPAGGGSGQKGSKIDEINEQIGRQENPPQETAADEQPEKSEETDPELPKKEKKAEKKTEKKQEPEPKPEEEEGWSEEEEDDLL